MGPELETRSTPSTTKLSRSMTVSFLTAMSLAYAIGCFYPDIIPNVAQYTLGWLSV